MLWRPDGAHHCSVCGRCVPDFDHHCFVIGCCIHGQNTQGNHSLFVALISCAAVALVGVFVPLMAAAAYSVRQNRAALLALVGAAALLLYLAAKGAMWFFFGRFAHLRVGIKKSQGKVG